MSGVLRGRGSFFSSWRRVVLVTGVVLALGACGPKKPPESPSGSAQKPKREEMEGGREATSPSRRASDNRPRPWAQEQGPFDSDRFGVGAYRVYRQEQENAKKGKTKTKTKNGQRE